jgi:hypothetical protein
MELKAIDSKQMQMNRTPEATPGTPWKEAV